MLSMILGGGAMVTGYFGMNFEKGFKFVFFDPPPGWEWMHHVSIGLVSTITVGSMLFAIFLVVRNWPDYRNILLPPKPKTKEESLRRTVGQKEDAG